MKISAEFMVASELCEQCLWKDLQSCVAMSFLKPREDFWGSVLSLSFNLKFVYLKKLKSFT